MKCKMIRFLTTDRPCKTAIDSLILFEQLINLVNGPVILMQLLRIFNPQPLCPLFRNIVFCRAMEATVTFALCHRSLGGTVIAGVRQVHHVFCSLNTLSLNLFIFNRVAYINAHNCLLRIGEEKCVNYSKWIMFLVSLLLTSSYVVEHSYLELECIGVQINLEAFVGSTGKAVSFHIYLIRR